MGFKLRREVRDALPPGVLTAGERLLVLEVADDANDVTREGWPGFDRLAEYADVSEAKVGEMFARIAKKWIELRVVAGFGRDGRPYYSRPGYNTHFRFPPLEILQQIKVPQIGVPKPPESGGPKATQNRETRPPKLGGPSPQGSSPQEEHSDLSSRIDADLAAAAGLKSERDASAIQDLEPEDQYAMQRGWLARHGVTDPIELRVFPALIEELHNVTKPRAWWPYVHRQGDLPACIDEARIELADSQLAFSTGSGGGTSGPSRPAWCGECDEPTRQVEIRDDDGRPVQRICPRCHPSARR